MENKPNLLVISEEPLILNLLKSTRLKDSSNIYFCKKEENIFWIIEKNAIKIVIIDSEGDESWDFKLLKLIKTFDPIIDVIVVGTPVASDKIIDWINLGAADYLIKPLHPETVELILRRLDEKRSLRRETYFLEKKLEKNYIFQGMVGKSPFMLEIFSVIENIAKYFSTVLIVGETGTGKELIARAIHKLSPEKNKRFIICDSTAIPENLFESELFGYIKGAFTGADRNKRGLLEEAHEGIIFLDEIGDIPLTSQAKLLRVLETHQFRPLGSGETRSVDVRVIVATNRKLREEVKKGTFREDLFHRLSKVEIHLPPLRKRLEDVQLLARYFLEKYAKKFDKPIKGVSREVQKLFLSYEWPGNIRELDNVIERAAIFCKKEFIDIVDLPNNLKKYLASGAKPEFFDKEDLSTLENLEKEYITYLMKKNNNNIQKTAKILNISRTTLYSKINKYNLNNSRH